MNGNQTNHGSWRRSDGKRNCSNSRRRGLLCADV
nr:hypothetical protein P5621_12965 [Bacillus subtilis]